VSPAVIVQTIQLIIAPVVMVTASALLINGILGRYAAINDRLRLLARERLELFHDPTGPRLAPPDPSDDYRCERLAQIDAQIPDLLRRHRMLRDAILCLYGAIAILVLAMFAIAAAAASAATWADWLSLILFLLGTAGILLGVTLTTIEVRLSNIAINYEVDRIMNLGRQ
jgi:hypothetical protein